MSDPYYRMYSREWDDGTATLTLEEEAALLRICNAINSRRAPLPDTEETDREMMHRCRVSMRKWRTLKAALLNKHKKITIENGMICQARALAEVGFRLEKEAQSAESGARGGRKRAENLAKKRRKSVENELKTDRKSPEIDTGDNENKDLGLPNPDIEPESDSKKDPAGPKKRTRFPEGFPDSSALEAAKAYWRKQGRTDLIGRIEQIADKFGSHHRSKGSMFVSWQDAWKTWYVNQIDFIAPPAGYTPPSTATISEDERWRSFLEVYKRRGDWEAEGPPPGEPGCLARPELQREFGFEPHDDQPPILKLAAGGG